MGVIELLEQLVEGYNAEKKCGFDWCFIYSRKDYANLVKYNNCCVYWVIEKFDLKENFDFDSALGISELEYIDYNVKCKVVSQSRLDRLIYDKELKEESKYITHVKPLLDCLQNINLDLCSEHWAIISKRCEPIYNDKDANLDGLILDMTIRKSIK